MWKWIPVAINWLMLAFIAASLMYNAGWLPRSKYAPWSNYMRLGTWHECAFYYDNSMNLHVDCTEGQVSFGGRK